MLEPGLTPNMGPDNIRWLLSQIVWRGGEVIPLTEKGDKDAFSAWRVRDGGTRAIVTFSEGNIEVFLGDYRPLVEFKAAMQG